MSEQPDMFGAPPKVTHDPKAKAPQFYVVPSRARAVECRGEDCTALVYWVPGIPCPVSCDVDGGRHPDAVEDPATGRMQEGDGRGVSHFINCPNASDFSRGSRKGRRA